jgi:type III secretion protein L
MIIWLRQHASEALARDERIGVGTQGQVVPREALAQLVELDEGYAALQAQHREVLAIANEKAAALVAQALSDAQALRDAAQREFDSAHERGYDAGQRKALADWYSSTAQMLVQRHQMQRSMSTRIAELVVAAVEKIVTVESPAALFARAAQEVERIVDGGSYLRVRVHPDEREQAAFEFERVAAHWRELDRAVALTVSALAPGACMCETDIGSIDASLEVQLDGVRKAVERAMARAGCEGVDELSLTEDCALRPAVVPQAGVVLAQSADNAAADSTEETEETEVWAGDTSEDITGDFGGHVAPDGNVFATRTAIL